MPRNVQRFLVTNGAIGRIPNARSICKTSVGNFAHTACVQGSTNGTNGIQISFKVLPMVPLILPLVPMLMLMVPLALPMIPLVSQ